MEQPGICRYCKNPLVELSNHKGFINYVGCSCIEPLELQLRQVEALEEISITLATLHDYWVADKMDKME